MFNKFYSVKAIDMSNKCDEDDILQYLPVLKKESTSKELIDDFNTESSKLNFIFN